ncbi:zf-HC2 domain-containing protein [Variovorax sp. Sphag1AA]|uniref:zf-HC2 domain-containing protein n=1 Tax=Variovorax sp. Sphag1AA TaxID=2587027 RepID=UPI0016142EEE|nr:zf-HC2 domain-containing protein [Variovorax sp. Sphag1AA]MBB3181852.1 anti-sigma factor RsiW [Variovorax sp. Sphag1AA]
MSGRVVQLGADLHQKVQALLPWYVGEGLDAEERASVEAHIAECPRCQAELAWEREVHALYAQSTPAASGDADQGFAALRERIAADASPPQGVGLLARLKARWQETPVWTRWTLAGQCLAVAVLSSVVLIALAPDPGFRALGSATGAGAAGGGNLIVRFRPEATEQEMRRVLRNSEARLVYGPTATDAYLLAVPAGLESEAVKRLRSERAVLLVESLNGRAAP